MFSPGCGVGAIGVLINLAPQALNPATPATPPQIAPLGRVAFGMPLGVNILATALIIGRIWYISRGRSSKATHMATTVVVESGALLSLIQLLFVILLESPEQNIVIAMAQQIYVRAPLIVITNAINNR
jgi:hypothetical protein